MRLMNDLAKTPLYKEHIQLGGKMVAFAGFHMPVQYQVGVLREYHAVRDGGAGLFDISHMGQVRINGVDSLEFLQYVTTNDVARLTQGQVQYSALLNESGAFIDDITTYMISGQEYYLCVNATNRARDVAHLRKLTMDFDVIVTDESDDTALLALQGGQSQTLLQSLVGIDLERIAYYHFAPTRILGFEVIVSRTGYTGEDGFELYLPNEAAIIVWRSLLDAGAVPVGLAARDMLRTEMGYALYGHEISDAVTPVEASLMWITRLEKNDFIGRNAVVTRKAEGPRKRLIALKLTERGVPREHYKVYVDGMESGEITSGMHSPMSGGVAMAYVKPEHAESGKLSVEIRGKQIPAERTTTPFVRSNVRR